MNRIINQDQSFDSAEALKITSLEYIKEALVKEEYEICPELIQAAKDAGATRDEIRQLLSAFVRESQGADAGSGKGVSRF